ncbi:MAG: ABC transporter ATP-binding protein, partial [Actinobacteria bacterium]|nr:ABC transporter ATP-binding protein [Actinomycetota bacterium]
MTVAPAKEFNELRLEGVGRSFGEANALTDLSLRIQQGEFIALLGPSGCGKSTALNCLAGLLPLTHGSIWQDDKRIDMTRPEKRGFGMVFQNYALFPHMSVRKNVAFGLEMRKTPPEEIKQRVAEAIELVHLEDQASKLPGQLSGGQQQRVAIARAVVLRPPLVLMDEPLSNLDAKLRLEMRTQIRRLHQALNLTTVYVTHDQEEALSLADRLVVLRLGRVQQIGTPRELYSRPANAFVADFMGYRNLLKAQVAAVEGQQVVVDVSGLQVHATAMSDLTVGDATIIGVRPDDVKIVAPGSTFDGLMVDGVVEVVEYQGRELVAEVRLPNGLSLTVRTDEDLHS